MEVSEGTSTGGVATGSGAGGDVEREGTPVGGGAEVLAGDAGGSGFYVDEDGEEEEDDGFAVTMNTQALSSIATVPTTSASVRPSRTAPQAMRPFDASSHGVSSVQPGAAGGGAQVPGVTAKVSASLTPMTTMGSSSSSTRVTLAPNPHTSGLLTQSDEARYYAHLQASAMENYPDKPWAREGVDPSDYFNYGFTEETWTLYRERQLALRKENGSLYQQHETHAPQQNAGRQGPRGGRQHGPRDTFSTASTFQPQQTQNEPGGRAYDARGERRGNARRDEDSERERDYRSEDSGTGGGNRRGGDNRGDNRGGRRDRDSGPSARDSTDRRYDDQSSKKRGRSPDTRDARDDDYRKKPRR